MNYNDHRKQYQLINLTGEPIETDLLGGCIPPALAPVPYIKFTSRIDQPGRDETGENLFGVRTSRIQGVIDMPEPEPDTLYIVPKDVAVYLALTGYCGGADDVCSVDQLGSFLNLRRIRLGADLARLDEMIEIYLEMMSNRIEELGGISSVMRMSQEHFYQTVLSSFHFDQVGAAIATEACLDVNEKTEQSFYMFIVETLFEYALDQGVKFKQRAPERLHQCTDRSYAVEALAHKILSRCDLEPRNYLDPLSRSMRPTIERAFNEVRERVLKGGQVECGSSAYQKLDSRARLALEETLYDTLHDKPKRDYILNRMVPLMVHHLLMAYRPMEEFRAALNYKPIRRKVDFQSYLDGSFSEHYRAGDLR